jgi:hypothetical protein
VAELPPADRGLNPIQAGQTAGTKSKSFAVVILNEAKDLIVDGQLAGATQAASVSWREQARRPPQTLPRPLRGAQNDGVKHPQHTRQQLIGSTLPSTRFL